MPVAPQVHGIRRLQQQPAEEPQQGLDLALLTNPQQPTAVGINLVNQHKIPVPALPGDLIYADRLYPRQVLVGAAPSNRHLHRTEHLDAPHWDELKTAHRAILYPQIFLKGRFLGRCLEKTSAVDAVIRTPYTGAS